MPAIPACLEHLPRVGGLPVPWFVTLPDDGSSVDFRVINVRHENLAIRFHLCSICGRYIERAPYTFLVGPSVLEQRLAFAAPTHRGCALAALELCPFLARREWRRSERQMHSGNARLYNRDELPPKPARVALFSARTYGYTPNPEHRRMPDPPLYVTFGEVPAAALEWWRYDADGKLSPELEPMTRNV